MINFKKSNGSISVMVLVSILFIVTILSATYMINGAQRRAQLKSQIELKSTYEDDLESVDQVYKDANDRLLAYKESELPRTSKTMPYLPSSNFSRVNDTDLSTGLVIEDTSGNQYVWVEVPKTTTVYRTAGLNITEFTDAEYTRIETDLHTYTSTYREGASYTDSYYADSAIGWFADETAYNTAKHNMLKSVYENGGFWIGRYETGIEDAPRTASGDTTQTPVIKANAYPYNYVTRTQAKVLAESMESGDRTSSLMFGVQWDLVLAYMHNKGGIADSTLTGDSKTIGNYLDNQWSITNATVKYSEDNGVTWSSCPKDKGESSSATLLTTGADASFGIMNIYDIAGNIYEWTLEKTSYSSSPCTTRGGSCYDYGDNGPASYRGVYSTTTSIDGFRVSLY